MKYSLLAVLPAATSALSIPLLTDLTDDSSGYDAIVVGAGPAGIIVADKLSAAGKKTLLLEGGGPSYYATGGRQRPPWLDGTEMSRVDVPGLYKSIFDSSTGADELTCSSEEVAAYGGCTVGGSSAINAGLYFQPPASDFDLYFPEGWKSADMANAIASLNKRQNSTDLTSQDGKRYLQSGYEAARKWLVEGAGYTEVAINEQADQKDKVFGHPIYDYNNGQRGGPATTYLQTALARDNFELRTGTRVQNVLRQKGVATGVQASGNATFALNKGGKVILSGGALQSPQLLMASGIGDAAILEDLHRAGKLEGLSSGDWINNTAVGAGLFDNPNTFIELGSPDVESYIYSYLSPVPADAQLYLDSRSGPYSVASQTGVFWRTRTHADGTVAGLQGTIDSAGYGDFLNNHTITLNIYGTSGLGSTGKVILDANFVATPTSDVYYSADQDADDIAWFIREIFDALPASGMTPLNIPQDASVEEIKSYITTASAYARGMVNHWSSSCRLGSCVDEGARVLGMENLYVVDGSIVPPLTVNPQMGIMIAAERASELILESWIV